MNGYWLYVLPNERDYKMATEGARGITAPRVLLFWQIVMKLGIQVLLVLCPVGAVGSSHSKFPTSKTRPISLSGVMELINNYIPYISLLCNYKNYGMLSFIDGQDSWWRHQMETFSALLALCAGNSPVPVNSPHKGQWREALCFLWSAPQLTIE